MISDPDWPHDVGFAAEPRKTRGSQSLVSSRVCVVILAATAMHAAVINDQFHKSTNAKVAPFAQFLHDGTIGMGTNDGAHHVASDFSGLTNRTVSAQTELVTRQGQSHRDALSAGSFTASYFSTTSCYIQFNHLEVYHFRQETY